MALAMTGAILSQLLLSKTHDRALMKVKRQS